MDEKNNLPSLNEKDNLAPFEGWTKRELKILQEYKDSGIKPISPALASQLYTLFLEGYSCAEIARLNKDKGITEGDVLYCREKYKWDEQRDEYAVHLTNQVQQKLMKQKLESIEFLTNMLAVIHKENREVMLRYLQTGNPDDLPKIGSLKIYKDILESLAKITGEDAVRKVKFEGKVEHDVKNDKPSIVINEDLQTKLLQSLIDSNNDGP